MERLKQMKECLISQVQSQMANLQYVDAKELGEVVDMIKDLEEAMYYCTITKAMGEKEEEKTHYYDERYPYPYYPPEPIMYYSEGSGARNGQSSTDGSYARGGRSYSEREWPMEMRDEREGRSPIRRKMYMESKEMHKDKETQMKELEKYLQELSADITEMIQDASPEEKQILQKKIAVLATKVNG